MHLADIDEKAADFQEKRAEIERIDEELEDVIADLRDKPKEAERESEFADFVGADTDATEEVEKLEDRKAHLSGRRETLGEEAEQQREDLMEAWVSDDLVVPLTTEPEKRDREWVFEFRDDQTFPNAITFLGETVGLGNPIRVEGVLISDSAVRVPIEEYEMSQDEAMETVMAAFEQLQNTLEMKLPDDEW
jgi:hypothetical protein